MVILSYFCYVSFKCTDINRQQDPFSKAFPKSSLGYYAAYTIAIGCTVLAMLYALFFLKDSRTMRPAEAMKEAEAIAKEIADGPEKAKEKDG